MPSELGQPAQHFAEHTMKFVLFSFFHFKASLHFYMVDEESEKEKPSLLPLFFFLQIDFNPYVLELTVFPKCLQIKSLGVTGTFVSESRPWFWKQQLLIIPMTFLTLFFFIFKINFSRQYITSIDSFTFLTARFCWL